MALDIVLFVSRRLQPLAVALVCFAAAQCTVELAEPAPAAARFAVTR
ncbi:MAG TPA: hypothetical protein VF699_08300 [Caulobacteraceae bacterium]|jgi:hypothetical protein